MSTKSVALQNQKEAKPKRMRSMKTSKRIMDWTAFICLLLGSVVMLVPFVWMLSTSFKMRGEEFVTMFIPYTLRWDTYARVWTEFNRFGGVGYLRALFNSLLYAIPPVIVGTLVSVLAAFSFAKIKFRGRKQMFVVMLLPIMIPFPAIMVPQFVLFSWFNWLRTPLTQIIPTMLGSVMVVFFVKQYYANLPDSIIEAAKIDGCPYWKMFLIIGLPLAGPAMAAQALLWFIGRWNDFLGPFLFIQNPSWFTLPVVLGRYFQGSLIQADIPVLMAGSILSIAPVVILFAIFQKAIIQSIMFSGMKE